MSPTRRSPTPSCGFDFLRISRWPKQDCPLSRGMANDWSISSLNAPGLAPFWIVRTTLAIVTLAPIVHLCHLYRTPGFWTTTPLLSASLSTGSACSS
jgi:hypothetical protein